MDRAFPGARVEDGWLRVQVSDEGKGFDPDELEQGSSGHGLAHMQERLRLLEGQLEVDAEHGQGTRITIALSGPFVESD